MVEHNIKGIHFIAGPWPLLVESPTVVFIHGVGNSSILWKAQVEGLAGSINTVAIDLPGHGESFGQGMDKISDYARIVAEFIDAIHAPSPIPCGLSMGGAITLQLLLDGNRRYKAGIIINSGVRLRVKPFIFDLIKSDYQGFAHSMFTSCISAKTDPSILQDIITVARNCNPDIAYNDLLACNTFDVNDRLHEITVPVLVLTAEEDQLTPAKFGRYLAEHIDNAHIAHIMEAGHISPVEKPEVVNRVIREFVNKTADG
jgi:pimeloyl-ACP methyl ester carboxylesterase